MKISSIFFDLGNVILFFDHMIICNKIERKYGINKKVAYKKIFHSGLESQFDRGQISPLEFTRGCSKTLDISMDVKDFEIIWADIFQANYPMIKLIKVVKNKARIFLLSNTNIWHIKHVKKKYDFLNLFDRLILSYDVGHTKPNRKFFEKALHLSGESETPNECIFIDDIEENVNAARDIGINGILFDSYIRLYKDLQRYNVLGPGEIF